MSAEVVPIRSHPRWRWWGEGKTAAALHAAAWFGGRKCQVLQPVAVGTVDQVLQADHLWVAWLARIAAARDAVKADPVWTQNLANFDPESADQSSGTAEVCSHKRQAGAWNDPSSRYQLLVGLPQVSAGPIDIAADVLVVALPPASQLKQRSGRVGQRAIEAAIGRSVGLSRRDARHWRQLIRAGFLRPVSGTGRSSGSSRATPNDTAALLPLCGALTPTAPPTLAA